MSSAKAERVLKRLAKKSNRGFCGYPLVKIGFYGPDNKIATKLKLKVSLGEDDPLRLVSEWESSIDIRRNADVLENVDSLIVEEKIPTVSMDKRIVGCPHYRGEDYAIDQDCPYCSFWTGKTQED